MFGSKSSIPSIHTMKLIGCSVSKSRLKQFCTDLVSILIFLQSYSKGKVFFCHSVECGMCSCMDWYQPELHLSKTDRDLYWNNVHNVAVWLPLSIYLSLPWHLVKVHKCFCKLFTNFHNFFRSLKISVLLLFVQ